jgi:hypothetical protein
MAMKKNLTGAVAEPVEADYRILSGFIFNHCIYTRGGKAYFSEQNAANLIARGLVERVK